MAGFFIYDLGFLVIFTIFIFLFLYKKRKNLKREGIMYLYRTKLGIKVINYIGKKYSRILHVIKYLVIFIGYLLMAGMIYLLSQTVYIYIKVPEITKIIKAPPIAPLIPYFPKIFGVESLFPPFYFTYFILALAIVAIAHEFSHGIFMRLFKIKIKSTGFAFLGPILGAFVEEDRKQFEKKKKIEQMSVLAAGTFANVVMSLLFFGLLIGFFFLAFSPAGFKFNSYSLGIANSSEITSISQEGNFTRIISQNQSFLLDENLKKQLDENSAQIIAYYDLPAVRSGLKGAIIQMNDIKIKNAEDLQEFLKNKNPGDKIEIKTIDDGEILNWNITLGENPLDKIKPAIGISHSSSNPNGIISKVILKFAGFKNPAVYYKPKFNGNFVIFIYNLFWWIMLINILVALFNMLPLGILDGGRFFYLTILSISGSEKISKIIFRFATYLILFSFILITLVWFFRVF